MKIYFVLCLFLINPLLIVSFENEVDAFLDHYKEYLKEGTYEGQDWSSFDVQPKSRYDTFKEAFTTFYLIHGKVVVELGTSRSFTHGGLPGCNRDEVVFWTPNSPENWDWGAGCFTRMAAECLSPLRPEIHTVDLCPAHLERCKVMTSDFKEIISYHVSSSVDFLKECDFPEGIDLLYLDTGDMTPIDPTALLQLEEAVVIVERNLISKNGLILIDDVKNQTPKKYGEVSNLGKSKYALPYLLDNGFEIVLDEYQVLLKRK